MNTDRRCAFSYRMRGLSKFMIPSFARRSPFVALSVAFAAVLTPTFASADDHGIALDVRGIISAYGSSGDPQSDVRAQSNGLTGPISATTHASRMDSGAGGVADASVVGDFGGFNYSASASANQTPSAPGSAFVGGDGQPAYESWDKLTVTGAPGEYGTFLLHLGLRNVAISSSNGDDWGIDMTGIQSRVQYYSGSSALNRLGTASDVIDAGVSSAAFDYFDTLTLRAGDVLYIDYQARCAAIANNQYDGMNQYASGSVSGEGFLNITSLTSGMGMTSASGHSYAVPEPSSLLLLGAGVLPLLLRRRKV
jgi:hypothetical protein